MLRQGYFLGPVPDLENFKELALLNKETVSLVHCRVKFLNVELLLSIEVVCVLVPDVVRSRGQ